MPRILVVDDQPSVLSMLRMMLEVEGHAVETAPDADTALARLTTNSPDVVLLDVMMPGKSGFDLAQTMRTNPGTSAIPIIFLTAVVENDQQWRGWALGGDSYVTKPFETETLLGEIARVLATREAPRNRAAQEPQVDKLVVLQEVSA